MTSSGPRRIDDILQSDADVIVETVGGVEPAAGWIRAALLAGKSVVTANKQVVARHGAALLTLAARQGRQLRFEAAVGGAMPIVRAIGDGLAGDRITRIVAILNGTTNAVLSRMEASGCSLEAALADARDRGYAEADPSADLDGDRRARQARDSLRRWRSACASIRAQIETPVDGGHHAPPTSRGCAEHGRPPSARLPTPSYDRAASALTAWVAPAVVPRDSMLRAHQTVRRTRR